MEVVVFSQKLCSLPWERKGAMLLSRLRRFKRVLPLVPLWFVSVSDGEEVKEVSKQVTLGVYRLKATRENAAMTGL